MDKGVVSIIIPVYNAEKYLERCMESILSQTHSQFEVILIDDGSTDGSGAICDTYEKRYSFIHVVHSANSGVGHARNIGLEMCKGEYITFVDSDDFIHPQYLEIMLGAVKKTGNEKPVCCKLVDVGVKEPVSISTVKNPLVQNVPFDETYDFSAEYAHLTCGGLLFNTKLCHELRFDTDLYVGEDTLFYYRILRKTGSGLFVPEGLYYYVHYAESAAHGQYNSKKFTEAIAWQRIIDLLKDYPRKIRESCQIACSCRCVALVRKM
ncbi:MAG: glycosyltransferase family 2 protein, partial [Lachnospiraceae bacterium]|nr:glycosyltransferase family 2 protein [Lachnospiraceae bacterium]